MALIVATRAQFIILLNALARDLRSLLHTAIITPVMRYASRQ